MPMDYSIFNDLLTNVNIATFEWIAPLGLLVILMVAITRNVSSMKLVAFPLAVLLDIASVPMNVIILWITGMVFALETFSLPMIGQMVSATYEKVSELTKDIRLRKYSNRVTEVRDKALLKQQRDDYLFDNPVPKTQMEKVKDLVSKSKKTKYNKKFIDIVNYLMQVRGLTEDEALVIAKNRIKK